MPLYFEMEAIFSLSMYINVSRSQEIIDKIVLQNAHYTLEVTVQLCDVAISTNEASFPFQIITRAVFDSVASNATTGNMNVFF